MICNNITDQNNSNKKSKILLCEPARAAGSQKRGPNVFIYNNNNGNLKENIEFGTILKTVYDSVQQTFKSVLTNEDIKL